MDEKKKFVFFLIYSEKRTETLRVAKEYILFYILCVTFKTEQQQNKKRPMITKPKFCTT